MMNILNRMTGEELLLMRILNGDSVLPAVEAELDRRAITGVTARTTTRNRQAGHTRVMIPPAKQAA
jgi:hypothetical protein